MTSKGFRVTTIRKAVQLLLLCMLIPLFAGAQDKIEKRGSDPLQNKRAVDSTLVNSMLAQADSLRGVQADTAILMYRRAIELAEEIDFERAKALGFKGIGLVKWSQSDFEGAEEYFKRSLGVFEKVADTTGIANIQSNLGAVYLTVGNDPKALEYLLQSLRNAEIVQDTLRMGSVYLNMGSIYSNEEETYDQAEESYLLAIEMFKLMDDAEPIKMQGLAIANANLGEVYLKRKEPRKSIPYLQESVEAYRELDGDVAAPLNWLGDAYREQEQFGQAEELYNEALKEARLKESRFQESRAHVGLGSNSLAQGRFQKAINEFELGLEIARDIEVLREQEVAARGIANAYAGLNNYKQAYDYQQTYETIRDSLRNINVEDALAKMQIQFDTERKEKEIELLNAENALNTIEIEKEARANQLLTIILGLFLAIIAGFVFQFFYIRRTNKRLAFERNRSEQILLNILPKETADELKEKGYVQAREFDQITVLFTDFKAFSLIAERVSADQLVKSVDYYFKNFDEITERHGLEKIKTIGDAYMCAGGIPTPNNTHVRDAFAAAREILKFVNETEMNPPKGIYPFKIRIGLNSGPVVAGVVGTKKFAYDIWGNTVNIAARMESGSVPGRINVSESIYEELKDEHEFTFRGELTVKNQVFKMYFADVPETVVT